LDVDPEPPAFPPDDLPPEDPPDVPDPDDVLPELDPPLLPVDAGCGFATDENEAAPLYPEAVTSFGTTVTE
jgi:hypothetical protein